MAEVELEHVKKAYGDFVAVLDFTLRVRDGEFVVLVGPSGCGKTTTLRMVAGLEDATDGEIRIDGRVVNDVPPKDRDIAMVFQSYALYPHMSVFDNMAFSLKLRRFPATGEDGGTVMRRMGREEIDKRVRNAAKLLGIEDQLSKKPAQLSGGQRQRVALGRAIVRNPKVFLFDEPLSNLDAKLRVAMRAELAKLHQVLKSTMIYVTHDQAEAMTLGDRVVVMDKGIIQQVDEPQALYDHPRNQFVAGFIGSPAMNFLDAHVAVRGSGVYMDLGAVRLRIPDDLASKVRPLDGASVVFGIRPEDLYDRLFAQAMRPESAFPAKVDVKEPMGSDLFLYLRTGDLTVHARMNPATKVEVDGTLDVYVDMGKMHLFDRESGEAIV
ncbi:MAG TPA: ABC transporter ATP-binding protein [Thermoplasmata archaeon]|nr:ABC transporter ATP-binding protein [Thermoplasmata archaeon]